MTAARSVLVGALLFLLAGCGGDGPRDSAESGKGGWSIPAGTYGNVSEGGAGSDLRGFEMTLDRGSESGTVDFIECNDGCENVETRPLRRGLNGISFTLYRDGRTVDVLVNPAGKDAVELSLDQGTGLESHRLPRMGHEVGLAIAQGRTDGTAMPPAEVPTLPSSPPPLPSPTP
ncbi:hypothetical protein [Sphingopyxis sp. KK2]|uniref:hypothetical protein n=1 Tax=Sphingopyxis sp. KK2 TaxID=1855727 RepID=UPI00097E608E|nr:hypothetical protein [Sphingopyxis sp. KK2]